jgi:tRNA 5-methylaminomethyl-2-thiouridine biosynthesis bifunctional protein
LSWGPGFLFGRRQLDALQPGASEPLMARSGVFQLVSNRAEEKRWPDLLERQSWPPGFVRWCSEPEAGEAMGVRPQRGGLWFAAGAVVSPAAWCRAMLGSEASIHLHAGRRVVRILQQSGAWTIEDQLGAVLRAPVLLVASAIDAPRLLESSWMPVRPIRGRISRLAAGELAPLRAGIAGQGYLVPGLDGCAAVGATYETIGPDQEPGLAEGVVHQSNLERLGQLLAQPATVRVEGTFDGIRCVATDRAPLAGAVADEGAALGAGRRLHGAHLIDLPRRTGLYCSFALGSRGLLLAPLLGDLIACLIEGEPAPIERGLAATVDPARFLLRRLRRNGTTPV